MPSAITSVIGGIQGASAAHNAANAAAGGYNSAGSTVQNAVSQVNPTLTAAGQSAAAGVNAAAGTANQYLNPYVSAGSTAESSLQAAAAPGGSIGSTFSGVNLQNDPSYQFDLNQGLQALQRSQAATGSASGGGAMKAIEQYGQGYASNAYQQAFNNFTTNKQQQYNMLSGIAASGQAAAGQSGSNLINAGVYSGDINTNETNLAGQNTLQGAVYKGNTQIGAGNAIAQGDLGASKAWNGALSGIGGAATSAAATAATGGWGSVFGF